MKLFVRNFFTSRVYIIIVDIHYNKYNIIYTFNKYLCYLSTSVDALVLAFSNSSFGKIPLAIGVTGVAGTYQSNVLIKQIFYLCIQHTSESLASFLQST